MPFKSNWEKTQTYASLTRDQINRAFLIANPNSSIKEAHAIEGGCANLNVKIICSKSETPQLLRFYLRDPSAALREKVIAEKLHSKIPIPQTRFVGCIDNLTFALIDFVEGITLSDLLLSNQSYDMFQIMSDIGRLLAPLSQIQFDKSGFIESDFAVQKTFPTDFPELLLSQCLETESIKTIFDEHLMCKLKKCISYFKQVSFESSCVQLVHGDFNPSNILVVKQEQFWRPSALLDFEFAYAGSVMGDISSMLREAHLMPSDFRAGFLHGLQNENIELPKDWKQLVHLHNILALLEIASRSDPKKTPYQTQDIHDLVIYHLNAVEIHF